MIQFIVSLLNSAKKGLIQLRRSSLLPLVIPFVLLIVLGTFAYAQLEGWTLVESLYATIITITTVGYGDLSPQTNAGRIFAIFFTLVAIGLAGYAISSVVAELFERQQEKSERKKYRSRMNAIAQLSDHVIVCGATIMGNRAAGEFKRRNRPFVLIDADEARLKRSLLWMNESYVTKRQKHFASLEEVDWSVEEQMSIDELAQESNVLYLLEDPSEKQQLIAAGASRAYGVVAAMDDDRNNTTIILNAKDIAKRLDNLTMRIVASAKDELNMHTLYLAGADRVISPNLMGGFTLASNMLDHDAAEFWDKMLFQQDQNMRFGDMHTRDHPEIVGWTVDGLREKLSQLVVAIRRGDEYLYTPAPEIAIQDDDILIVVGNNLVQ